jgi:flagellar motor component MotA
MLTGYISKNYQDKKAQLLSNYVWFSSEAMITLGMIGTVAGFLLMLGSAFSNLDVTNIANVQSAIADMAIGMSTALSTTLIGLICSVLIKAQMVILENSWDVSTTEVQE